MVSSEEYTNHEEHPVDIKDNPLLKTFLDENVIKIS